jgi:hypothetical protein
MEKNRWGQKRDKKITKLNITEREKERTIVCPDQCDSKKIGIVAKHVTCDAMVENL